MCSNKSRAFVKTQQACFFSLDDTKVSQKLYFGRGLCHQGCQKRRNLMQKRAKEKDLKEWWRGGRGLDVISYCVGEAQVERQRRGVLLKRSRPRT